MDFEPISQGGPAAPMDEIAHDAIVATSTTYTNDPSVDVEELLRVELSSRGLRPVSEERLRAVAARIRSGHAVRRGDDEGTAAPGAGPRG